MAQERLNNDEFFTRLTTLMSSTHAQAHGSIFLTQKPLLTSTSDDSQSTGQILVRASNGVSKTKKYTSTTTTASKAQSKSKPQPSTDSKERIKFATVVEPSDLETFYTKYAEVCKKGMEGLRKRDKKKAKAKAKKKGKGAGGVS